jgi:SAM-dependent methyltransferase
LNVPTIADTGRATLETIEANLGRYNTWMFEQIRPAIGNRILEIGSGIGNMSAFMTGAERLALSDVDPRHLDDLACKFGDRPGVTVSNWDLGQDPPEPIANESFDTVVCLNVLEHIEDDVRALRRMHERLVPGGRLALLVPAHAWLFNDLDHGVGHFRRYARRPLMSLVERSGFAVETCFHFNMVGAIGWLGSGTILRRKTLGGTELGLFDRLVPMLRLESRLPRPFGISLIAIARRMS